MTEQSPQNRRTRMKKNPLNHLANLTPVPEGSDSDDAPDVLEYDPVDVMTAPESELPDYSEIRVEPVPPKKIVETPDKTVKKDTPKTGIPSVDEWQDFIGRIVLRTITDAFLSMVLRDIESELTPRERASIELTKDDLREMSAPMASLAHKSSFGRKKGRAIIAASDSIEAVLALFMWMRRVRKLTKKYRPTPTTPVVVPGYAEENNYGNAGQNARQGQDRSFPHTGVFNPGTG